jgi:type IX secretion system PorP/SprF family membrane protein
VLTVCNRVPETNSQERLIFENKVFFMRHFLLAIISVISFTGFSQQEPLFSQFWNAKTYYNPATTGMYYKHLSTTIGRWQDVGVDGAPVTQLLGYAINLKKLHGGLGFTYMHDYIGNSVFNKTKFNYSYHIALKNGGTLSLGAAAGFNSFQYDGEIIPPTTSTDPTINIEDGIGFTGDLGIVYSSKKMNFALSTTQLTSSRLGSFEESPHVVLMTDYIFGKEDGLQLKPQVFVISDLVKVNADINAQLLWKQKIGAGITYKTTENISFSVNWDILKKFRVGYAYDFAASALSGISKGSHTGFFGLVFKEAKERVPNKK